MPFDFQSSAYSFDALNTLFINVIKVSVAKVGLKKRKGKYLQLVYFNTLLGCNSNNDTIKLSNNIYSDVSKILSYQISAIEASFKKSINKPDNYYILEPVSINDNNSAILSGGYGFKNDIKQKILTPKEIELLEKRIQEAKNNKIKN